MSTAKLGPLAINASSPEPWTVPLAALESIFYPQFAPHLAPSLVAAGVLFALEFLLAMGAIWVRVRRGNVRLWQVQAGLLIPSTALIWLILIAATLIILQAQVWVTYGVVHDHGSYHGLYLLRGMAWTFGHGFIYTQLLGLALSTGFSARATGGLLSARGTSIVNAVSIGLPVLIVVAILSPTIAGQVACSRQFDTFKATRRIGLAGQTEWTSTGNLNNDTVKAFYGGVERIASSKCSDIQLGLYSELAVWVAIEIIATIVIYVALSRKLIAQIELLTNAVQTFRRLERADVLPSKEGDAVPKTVPVDLEHSKSVPYASYAGTVEVVGSGSQLALDAERERAVERYKLQEKRARGLKAGLNQLRWLSGLTVLATVAYLITCMIVLIEKEKGQRSAYWFDVETSLGIWNICIIGGVGITILLISGLDPERQSFLGISLHSAREEDTSIPDASPGLVPKIDVEGGGMHDPGVVNPSWQGFRKSTPTTDMVQSPLSPPYASYSTEYSGQ